MTLALVLFSSMVKIQLNTETNKHLMRVFPSDFPPLFSEVQLSGNASKMHPMSAYREFDAICGYVALCVNHSFRLRRALSF